MVGVILIALLLLVTGRRMSNGASIADQLPPDAGKAGPDVRPAQTGPKPDIGADESGRSQPPA